MRLTKVLGAAVVVGAMVAGTATQAAEIRYQATDLGDLGIGQGWRFIGLNNYGQVAGTSRDWPTVPLLWTPTAPNAPTGSLTVLATIAGSYESRDVRGLSDTGVVVGSSDMGGMYRWTPDQPRGTTGTLEPLPTVVRYAYGVNAAGQIATDSLDYGPLQGGLWTPITPGSSAGTMVNVGVLPGGTQTRIAALSNYGQAVGQADREGNTVGFVWTPTSANGGTGTLVELPYEATAVSERGDVTMVGNGPSYVWVADTPHGSTGTVVELPNLEGTMGAYAMGINSRGQVVGWADPTTPTEHAVLWEAGRVIDLNEVTGGLGAGWVVYGALAINEPGQILARGRFVDPGAGIWEERIFLLTPVPEPGSAAVLVVGAVLLGRRRR